VTDLDHELLYEVSEQVMGDCAFLMLERHDGPIAWPDEVVQARIGFSGTVSGSFAIQAPRSLLVTMAGDMLGVEPDDPAATESGEAALAEVANVLLGVLLARWLGAGANYEMALPVVLAGAAGSAGRGYAAAFLDENGHPLRAVVTIDESEAA
jgi:CheY-specific phosphatase CheX